MAAGVPEFDHHWLVQATQELMRASVQAERQSGFRLHGRSLSAVYRRFAAVAGSDVSA
jgi:hypothetical protein